MRFAVRLRERSLSTIFTPYASFRYESPPEAPAQPGPREAEYARERWGGLLSRDPYHSPNLLWDPENTDMIKGKPFAPGPAQKKDEEAAREAAGIAPKAQPVPLHTPRKTVEVPPPFFIVGHGRSGTTWLELTMNSHPEIVCKGSGMFFGRNMPLYEDQRALPAALANTGDLKTWHDMRPNYWSRNTFEEDLPGIVKALADYTMGAELAESGKSLAGDRTPHYVSYLEELQGIYPEAKVIHVIRDGRDVAISNIHAIWQNARDKGGPVDLEPEVQRKRDAYLEDREKFLANGESIFTGYRINQLAESWRDAVNKGREDGRRLFDDHYTEIRYEDLLDDPHSELSGLFEFLGVDRSEEVVDRAVEENRFEKVTGRQRGQEDPDHFNRKGVAGDWQEVFTDRDNRVFEEKAGETLAKLSYETSGAPSRKPSAEKESKTSANSPALATRKPAQAPPPFFVAGHGRSGTTWSERLLNSHPEVLCKGTGMFFGRDAGLFEGRKTLYSTLANSEDLKVWHDMQPNYWSDRSFEEELPGMVKAVTDHVMGSELARTGMKIVGDRTPHHVSYLDEIQALYPESKVVHVIRDGRDVVISNVHAFWNSARDRGGPIDLNPEELERRDAYLEGPEAYLKSGESIFTEERIRQLAESWRRVVGKGRRDGRQLFGGNYREIRYENLLDTPHSELDRLFEFLEVGRDDAVVNRVVEANLFEKRSSGRSRGEEDTKSFLRKGIHGDWKNVFNERDKRVFKEQTDDLLVVLGYEKDLGW